MPLQEVPGDAIDFGSKVVVPVIVIGNLRQSYGGTIVLQLISRRTHGGQRKVLILCADKYGNVNFSSGMIDQVR